MKKNYDSTSRRIFVDSDTFVVLDRKKGQIMMLTVMAIGGTILGVTTIAGLLMLYQIRQTTDLANSGKAIYAADAGTEWGLYQIFQSEDRGNLPVPTFSNGSVVTVTCYQGATPQSQCGNSSTTSMKSVGSAGGTSRAFGVSL